MGDEVRVGYTGKQEPGACAECGGTKWSPDPLKGHLETCDGCKEHGRVTIRVRKS